MRAASFSGLIKITKLFISDRLSASPSESQTVEVQPGEEVTLKCSNISKVTTHTFWSRLDSVNRHKISCIASMNGFAGDAAFCHGFENGRFTMSSNVSFVFLKIKQVDLWDSGLYLCGFYVNTHTVVGVIHVKVGGRIEGLSSSWCPLWTFILKV